MIHVIAEDWALLLEYY